MICFADREVNGHLYQCEDLRNYEFRRGGSVCSNDQRGHETGLPGGLSSRPRDHDVRKMDG